MNGSAEPRSLRRHSSTRCLHCHWKRVVSVTAPSPAVLPSTTPIDGLSCVRSDPQLPCRIRSKFSFAWPPRTGARKPSSVVKPPATPPHTNHVQKYFFRRRHNTQLPKFISAAIAPLESALHLCIQRLDRVGERHQTFFAMQSRRKTIVFWRR